MKKLLKFVEDTFYDGQIKYSNGEVKEVDNSLGEADRWLRRGKAIELEGKEIYKPKAKLEPKKDEHTDIEITPVLEPKSNNDEAINALGLVELDNKEVAKAEPKPENKGRGNRNSKR